MRFCGRLAGTVAARVRRCTTAGMSARSAMRTPSSTLPRFGQVMGFGDDEREVLTFTSGHGHVQATPRRRRRGERDAARGRVALGSGFGGGIRELYVLADVVTRQGDGAVSVESGHGHVALFDRVGRGDGPALTIAHRLPHTRAQSAIVPALLDVVVYRVDVFGASCRDRQRLTRGLALLPEVGDRVEMLGKRAGSDAAVGAVGVEHERVAVTQLQRRSRLPSVGEPVEGVRARHAARCRTTRGTCRPAPRLGVGGGHRRGRVATGVVRRGSRGVTGQRCSTCRPRRRSPSSQDRHPTTSRRCLVGRVRRGAWRPSQRSCRSRFAGHGPPSPWAPTPSPPGAVRGDRTRQPATYGSCPPPPAPPPTPGDHRRPRRSPRCVGRHPTRHR